MWASPEVHRVSNKMYVDRKQKYFTTIGAVLGIYLTKGNIIISSVGWETVASR